ncbi:MAG: tRNA (cytidine(56)-2'-O)-methyltransferase [Candidatus Diapherotrites archaeon]
MVKEVAVLRLGHRIERDKRVSSHCALVARALGAREIIFSGEEDKKLIESIKDVVNRWGGKFKVSYSRRHEKEAEEYKKKKFKIVHLTMYGLAIQKEIKKIRKHQKIMVIVGAEKVPKQFYKLSDYNVSVSSQPHSEIAALAVFLHELFKGKELEKKFSKPKISIKPSIKGKEFIKYKK